VATIGLLVQNLPPSGACAEFGIRTVVGCVKSRLGMMAGTAATVLNGLTGKVTAMPRFRMIAVYEYECDASCYAPDATPEEMAAADAANAREVLADAMLNGDGEVRVEPVAEPEGPPTEPVAEPPPCSAKHTKYNPTDAEFVCPKCGTGPVDGGLCIDSPDPEAAEACGLLHEEDELRCLCEAHGECTGYFASGKQFAARVAKQRGLVTCPTCKGKALVPGEKP
jgi:hypothetical protein